MRLGPIALAGVIGGADSAISETTTRIVFESANFQATSVRLTSAHHRLRTDASMRFEKALDPENTIRGLARIVSLLSEVCSEARPAGGVVDNRAAPRSQEPILLPLSFVVRKLGKQLTEEEVSRILGRLGLGSPHPLRGCLVSQCRAGVRLRTFRSKTTWSKRSDAWSAITRSRPLRRW